MKERTLKTKLLTVLLTLCLALSIVPITVFADSGSYAVKFYPGDYGTMTKNDQIPFVYYGIDDDVNKPYYYKLNVTETETFGFVGSIMDTLRPNSGYEFAYWTADAAVYQVGSGTAIPAGTALSSDQIQNSVNVRSDNVTFTAHFKQISEYPDDSVITSAAIQNVKFDYQPGDFVFVKGIRDAIVNGRETIPAKVITQKGVEDITLYVKGLTADEKTIICEGCLMNYYAALNRKNK